MADVASPGPADYEKLESYLRALSYANRLELLALLRWPKTLDEIRLSPSAAQAGESPDRPISRQAVQNHMDKLIESGLVRVRSTDRKGKRTLNEYVVDHARLFAVLEELRKISTFENLVQLDPFATEGLPSPRDQMWEDGPKCVLVRGVHEGRAYALRSKELKPGRGWVIGRAADVHVTLDYDPFVSQENTEILRENNQWKLLDLRTSRNGTLLNWRRLPIGGEAALKPGDIIGVGRSLLLFKDQ